LPACGLRGDFLTLNGDFLTLNGDFLTLPACKYFENKRQIFIETRRNKKKELLEFSEVPKTGHAPPALMGLERKRDRFSFFTFFVPPALMGVAKGTAVHPLLKPQTYRPMGDQNPSSPALWLAMSSGF